MRPKPQRPGRAPGQSTRSKHQVKAGARTRALAGQASAGNADAFRRSREGEGVAARQGAAPRCAAACPLRGGFAGPDWTSARKALRCRAAAPTRAAREAEQHGQRQNGARPAVEQGRGPNQARVPPRFTRRRGAAVFTDLRPPLLKVARLARFAITRAPTENGTAALRPWPCSRDPCGG